ncbi:MAG: ROK family protein [Paraclostridium sp.]
MKKYACLDIGGTYIKYSVLTEEIEFVLKDKTPTIKHNIYILDNIKNIIRTCKQSHDIQGICISSAGIIDADNGKVVSATLIPGYSGTELKEELEKEFKIKCEVENDVNCVGIAEHFIGVAKDTSSSVCLAVGTGIGGCIIINNKIINGFTNSAGELGYMHIKNSRFSQLATTSSLVRNVSKLKSENLSGEEIFKLANLGDEICIREIDIMLENLATGIANIIYIINPEVIVLGGGIMEQQEYIKPILDMHLKKMVVCDILENTSIKFAKNQNDSGMIGALKNYLQKNK